MPLQNRRTRRLRPARLVTVTAAIGALVGGLLLPSAAAAASDAASDAAATLAEDPQLVVPGFDIDAFAEPDAQKPAVLWFWDRVQSKEQVEAKLASIHDAGFTETVIFRWMSNIPEAYFSQAWFDRVEHLLSASRDLGLKVWLSNDFQFPSGSAGGYIVNGGQVGDKTYEPRPDLGVKTIRQAGSAVRNGGGTVGLHELFGSSVQLENGRVVADSSSAPGITLLRDSSAWTDYTVTADFAIREATAGFMVRSSDERNGYLVDVRDDGGVDIWRQTDGAFTRIQPNTPRSGFDPNGDHRIEITVEGAEIRVTLDDIAEPTVTDATHPAGGVGMRVDGPQVWELDDLTVAATGGDELFSNSFDDEASIAVWDTETKYLDDAVAVTARPASGEASGDVDQVIDVTEAYRSESGEWAAPEGQWRFEAYSSTPRGGDRASYVDAMSAEAQELYLEIIYDEYYERFGEYFGTTFLGFADDEPEVGRHGDDLPPWSPDLGDRIEAGGLPLGKMIASIYQDFGPAGDELRARYYQEMSDQWVDTYWKTKYDWADEHGISMISNPLYDEYGPAGRLHESGNLMTMHQWAQIPGTDLIFDHVERGWARNLPREPASVAHQLGRPLVYDELMGATGWHKTIADVRVGTAMSAVRGINKALYHATFDAPETGPFPPVFSQENTWWKFVPQLNEWTGRLMEFGRHTTAAQTGLVQMQRAAEMVQRGDEASVDAPYFAAQHGLEDAQVDFDIVDEGALSDDVANLAHAVVNADGTLQVGEMRYRTIVVPSAPVMSLEAAQRLLDFVEAGGEVIFAGGAPEREIGQRDGELAEVVAAMVAAGGERVVVTTDASAAGAAAAGLGRAAVTLAEPSPALRVLRFEQDGTSGFMLVNEGETAVSTDVTFGAAGVPVLWDPDTGEVGELATYRIGDASTTAPLTLEPFVPVGVTVSPEMAPSAHALEVSGPAEVVGVAAEDGTLSVDLRSDAAGETSVLATDGSTVFSGSHMSPELPAAVALDGTWSVAVGDGQPQARQLGSWTEFAPNHSGDATYTRSVEVPDSDASWVLDLGEVANHALVEVDGRQVASLVNAPYRVDLGDVLEPGMHEISVVVTNTDANVRGGIYTSGLLGPVALTPYTTTTVELAEYQAPDPVLEVAHATVAPGDEQVVTGSGFAAETEYALELQSEPVALGPVTTDAQGGFTFAFTVPQDLTAGEHSVVVFADGAEVARASFAVAVDPGPGPGPGGGDGGEPGTPPGTSGDGGSLASTGVTGVVALLLAAAALLGLGLIAKRRGFLRRIRSE